MSRNITIVTAGSRGDAQPYVALGMALAARGHTVTVATHETFRTLVTGRGLGFFPVAGDPRGILGAVAADRWLGSGRRRHMVGFARSVAGQMRTVMDAMEVDFRRAIEGADLVVYSAVAASCARMGVPAVAAFLQPLHRTHRGLEWLVERMVRGSVNERPAVYGYSERVWPRASHWDASIAVTGYWVLGPEPGWQPPRALVEFLAAGPPPVAIGFGSMTPRGAERLTGVVIDGLRRSGQRGVLLGGWGALGAGASGDSVLVIDECPHEWLFPQTMAVVHHGGAGTTGAALRGGTPSIVVPLGFDQPYWARRVAALGVGPAGIARRRLTAEWLAGAIRRATEDQPMRARAARLGAALRAEPGAGLAASLIERHCPSLSRRSSSYPGA